MIYHRSQGLKDTGDFYKYTYKDKVFYYRGLFFLRGLLAGEESIAALAETYDRTGRLAFLSYYGSFQIVIVEKETITMFTDNSNMNCFYFTDHCISSSFLSLIKAEAPLEFDENAIYEYIVYGNLFFDKTFFKECRILKSSDYFVIGPEGIKRLEKGIGGIDKASTLSNPQALFDDITYATSGNNVAISLTGGYDSRMVYTCLKNNENLHPFISGNNLDDKDILISQKVAAVFQDKQEIITMDKPAVDEKMLKQLYLKGDGLKLSFSDAALRIDHFLEDRKQQGYDLYINGDTGTIHKDWFWMQDLPRYHKKRFRIETFYNQRILMIDKKLPLGTRLRAMRGKSKDRILHYLESERKDINTRSYDIFLWNLLLPFKFKTNLNCLHNLISTYSPLIELDLVRYSYHLPRRKRFFYTYIRETITAASKKAARIPTNYGMTASSEKRYLLRDIFFQLLDYGKKGVRLFFRVVFKKNVFLDNYTNWSCEKEIRALDTSKKALAFCKEKGWIAADAEMKEIEYDLLNKCVHLYYLNQTINTSESAS